MTHVLKTDVSSLERRLNKKVCLATLAALSLPSSGISVVEDCSALAALTAVDLSGNPLASKEAVASLFGAKLLESLDLRNCPVAAQDNYRRWAIAHNARLRVLDGKEVTALERRYAYNLFPLLKPGGDTASPTSGAASRPAGDDLFGTGALPVPAAKPAEAVAAAPEFFAVSSLSPGNSNNNNSFFAVTPMGHTVAVPSVAPLAAAAPAKRTAAEVPQDMFAAAGKRSMLLDNDILNRHASEAGLDTLLDRAPSVKPPPAAGRDALLDNDVLSGHSFLERKTRAASDQQQQQQPAAATKKPVAASIDIAGMFFENLPQPAATKKKGDEPAEVKLFDDKPVVRPVNISDVQFGGAKPSKEALPQAPKTVVETYQQAAGEELGESVSYDVEIVSAYVMRGFRPGPNVEAIGGLFEFSVLSNLMSPDTFYVRVSSRSGVSVHAGHVPTPERWSIDCRISLSEETMKEMLNGTLDPSLSVLSGKMTVDGSLDKLLLFRDVFRFALSRYEAFRASWTECVRQEEKDLAALARGSVLETDFHDALEFLLFAWRGSVPAHWPAGRVGYMLFSQLPDNLFYKGFRAQQHYSPPKVLLKMTSDCVEILPFAEEALSRVLCHVVGKKSILRSLLTGSMSLNQMLGLLAGNSAQYRYGAADYVVSGGAEIPPFLYVRNVSGGDNEFEQMLRCFDITCLSYDRFCQEKKAKQKQKLQQHEELLQRQQQQQQQQQDGQKSLAGLGTTPPQQKSTSSLDEWVEKLKDMKDDVRKRLNTNAGSPKKASVFDDDEAQRELKPMVPRVRADAQPERGFAPILPKLSDYEL